MGKLENPRHEKFCEALAAGVSASQAYRNAGYEKCHRQNASRLSSMMTVKARVAELKEKSLAAGETDDRDPSTGRFLSGREGGPGRAKGSRNRLAELFISDLHHEWEKSGAKALQRVAEADPVAFTKIVAGILPAKIDQTLTTTDVNLFIECKSFHEAFVMAQRHIGVDEPLLIEAQRNE